MTGNKHTRTFSPAANCLCIPFIAGILKSSAGEGFFWFLVVVITIIVQAVRASKQNSQKSEEKDSLEYNAPEDELRNFLESIGGQPRQRQEQSQPADQEPSAAQTASVARSSNAPLSASATAAGDEQKRVAYEDRTKHSAEFKSTAAQTDGGEPKRRRYVSSVAAPKGKPSTIEKTELQVRGRKPEKVETAASITAAPMPGSVASGKGTGTNIVKYLRSRNSLREAVILREILGPPVALRSEPTQRITQ